MILESIQIILLFGIIGAFTNFVAWKKGFYRPLTGSALPIPFKLVAGVFGIYLGMMLLIAPYIMRLFLSFSYPNPPSPMMANSIQLMILGALIIFLFLFSRSQGRGSAAAIWKNYGAAKCAPIFTDIGIGMMTWLVSFPIVAVIGQLLDLFIYLLFGVESYEQVAVRYLRSTLGSPSQIVIALLTILIVAPAVEEFLFRGCLQTFFKKHLGVKAAILLSSLCFAFFHFSSSQGIGNLSLLFSLFVFAGFLGFVYERQSSLFASIGLHMTFNLASALRILFFPDG